MNVRIRLAGPAALVLAACTTASPPSRTAGLANLPLEAEVRTELATALRQLSGPEARSACTPDEIAFMRVSLTLYAVAATANDDTGWSTAERARVADLQRQFDAMGGDARDVSLKCQAMAASLAG